VSKHLDVLHSARNSLGHSVCKVKQSHNTPMEEQGGEEV